MNPLLVITVTRLSPFFSGYEGRLNLFEKAATRGLSLKERLVSLCTVFFFAKMQDLQTVMVISLSPKI